MKHNQKEFVSTIQDLVDKLSMLYPNNIFELEKLSDIDKSKYIGKLELIAHIKQLGGLNDTK